MKTKKDDLVEIEFTGKIKGTDQVFDTTDQEEAKKAGLVDDKVRREFKPMKVFIGKGQVAKGFDKVLEDKETGKDYHIEIDSKDAYGKRDAKLIKTLPMHAFEQQPVRGMFVNVNGLVARVISVTGGRVLVDFNNPLSGKDLVYDFKIIKIITDKKEKITVLVEKYRLKPEIEEKEGKLKVKIKGPEQIVKNIEKEAKELNIDAIFEVQK
ncbi:MAG: FKBP-type peptidyl-prolyl cis-trans isomerase [archaeon]|nr:MAG: FKBP-type peptidyl-prolyl cis-trans isomerase [archaeon]